MTFHLNQIGGEKCIIKIHYRKIFDDNTMKEMCSSFSRNNGTIRILTYFIDKNHGKLLITDKILIQYNFVHDAHLSCTFDVIIVPNEKVIAR